jgi:hypothetical protein
MLKSLGRDLLRDKPDQMQLPNMCKKLQRQATPHPLKCSRRKEGENKGEGTNEKPWKGIDHRDLLEDDCGLMEGAEKCHVPISNL